MNNWKYLSHLDLWINIDLFNHIEIRKAEYDRNIYNAIAYFNTEYLVINTLESKVELQKWVRELLNIQNEEV